MNEQLLISKTHTQKKKDQKKVNVFKRTTVKVEDNQVYEGMLVCPIRNSVQDWRQLSLQADVSVSRRKQIIWA